MLINILNESTTGYDFINPAYFSDYSYQILYHESVSGEDFNIIGYEFWKRKFSELFSWNGLITGHFSQGFIEVYETTYD